MKKQPKIKATHVSGNEVEIELKDGTLVFVNIKDQTVEIEEELVDGDDYIFFLQVAEEVFAEKEEEEMFDQYGYQDRETGEWLIDRSAIARDRRNEFLADYQ